MKQKQHSRRKPSHRKTGRVYTACTHHRIRHNTTNRDRCSVHGIYKSSDETKKSLQKRPPTCRLPIQLLSKPSQFLLCLFLICLLWKHGFSPWPKVFLVCFHSLPLFKNLNSKNYIQKLCIIIDIYKMKFWKWSGLLLTMSNTILWSNETH